MLWLDFQAPFAAFRPFVAGWYRPTAGFPSHSAIYGLVLNLAGIESRLWEHDSDHEGQAPASLTRSGLPRFRLALGVPDGFGPPLVQSIFQQLHNYPVGADSGISPELAKGRKNNISPVRRELLCDVRAVAAVQTDDENFLANIRGGLKGEKSAGRYGLPFLGDNNFLLDSLEETAPRPARWYTLVTEQDSRPRAGTTRLTVYIDRADMSGCRSALFAPEPDPNDLPPQTALVPVGSATEFDHWRQGHSSHAESR